VENLALPASQIPEARTGFTGSQRLLTRQGCLYLAVFLVIALLWSADTQRLSRPLYDLDDPYITLHNAQALLSGQDANYGLTHPLTGATSAIHLILVTTLLLFVQPVWALHLANWLAILLYALGLARLAFQHRAACWQAALLVGAGLLVAETPYILLNGLETGLAMAGVVWALTAATTPRPTRWLPALCGLLPFLRPELAALSVLLMGYQIWRRWRADRSVPRVLRAAALDVGVAAAAALPWVIWYWVSTGLPYPCTIEAKRRFFAEGLCSFGFRNAVVLSALERFCLFVGTFGWCAVLLLFTRLGRLGLLFAAMFIGAYYVEFPSAFWQNQQRYLYLLLPLLLYGAASWLASPREGPRHTATCLLVVAVVQSAVLFTPRWQESMIRRQRISSAVETAAQWCQMHLPAHTRLLIHDAGYLSCATDFPLTDLVGLKSPDSIRDHRELTWTSAGARRAEAIARIARRNRAECLIVSQNWNQLFHISAGLQKLGWKVKRLNPGSDFYEVYGLSPPA
jgi:hypothetical protein